MVKPLTIKKLYVQIKNPDDSESLMVLKKACQEHPGSTEIILVLGEDKKSAIRLPFKVDDDQAFLSFATGRGIGYPKVVLDDIRLFQLQH